MTGRFLLDSGAEVSAVRTDAAKRFGLRAVKQGAALIHGVGGASAASILRADTTQLGPVVLTDVPFVAADLNSILGQGGGGVPDGIIGSDVLLGVRATLSYRSGRLTLADPEPPAILALQGKWVAEAVQMGHIQYERIKPADQIELTVRGRSLTVLFPGGSGRDVRSTCTLTLSPLATPARLVGRDLAANGVKLPADLHCLYELKDGRLKLLLPHRPVTKDDLPRELVADKGGPFSLVTFRRTYAHRHDPPMDAVSGWALNRLSQALHRWAAE